MKTTGMTRRIDELGRIVIPKEIRKVMRLDVGEELEIYVDKQSLILKKYSAFKNSKNEAKKVAKALFDVLRVNVLVCDLDRVIAAKTTLNCDYENKPISDNLKKVLQNRTPLEMQGCGVEICDQSSFLPKSFRVLPIISAGDVRGGVIAFSDDRILGTTDLEFLTLGVKMLTE